MTSCAPYRSSYVTHRYVPCLVVHGHNRQPGVEECVEIDNPVRENWKQRRSDEREDLPQCGVRKIEVYPVVVPNHTVAKSICCNGKFDRHAEVTANRRVHCGERIVDDCASAHAPEIVMHNCPMVVMRYDLLCFCEDVTGERAENEHINDSVVEAQHGVMKLRHNQVFVVARIADNGRVCCSDARHVPVGLLQHSRR